MAENDTELEYYPTIKQSITLSLRFLLFSVVFGALAGLLPSWLNNKSKQLNDGLTLLSYILAMGLTIWLAFVKIRKNEMEPIGLKFNKVPVIPVVVSVFMIMTMPVLTDPVSVIFPMSDAVKKMFDEMSDNNIFSLITVVIAAPILEEILFRGIILNGLLKNYSPQTAIITSAAIFAVVHLNPWQAIPAFLGGIIMAWMYWKTNSIIPGLVLHFINNLFSVLLGLGFKEADNFTQLIGFKGYLLLFAIAFGVVILGWMYLEKYFENHPVTGDEGTDLSPSAEQ